MDKLQKLKKKLDDLKTAARSKIDIVKQDTPAADATRIEGEHKDLLEQIRSTEAEIAALEVADAQRSAGVTLTQADVEAAATRAATEAARAERERATEITTLADQFGVRELGVEHVRTGSTVDGFRSALLTSLAGRTDTGPTVGHVREGQDETETRRQAAINGQMVRGSVRGANLSEAARGGGFHVMRFVDLAREALGWAGTNTRGLSEGEVIERALHSTSDFPLILSGIVNATLLQAYQQAPQTFRPWTRQVNVTDFRALNMIRLDTGGSLRKVNEHGEFKRGTLTESKETVQVSTFGEVIGVTRQLLINDNLGALTQVPEMLGRRALQTESDIVYRVLLSNQVLASDNKAIFHTDHSNLASSSAAIAAAELGKGRLAMSKQTGLDGQSVLGIAPAFLLIPPELEMAAAQILSPINAAQTSNVVPEFIRSLTTISEPRLSVGLAKTDGYAAAAGSTTAYFLAASPGQIDTIVYAYLSGQTGPYIETRQGFNVDGMEIKIRHDFGAAPADFRGLWKNAGAG